MILIKSTPFVIRIAEKIKFQKKFAINTDKKEKNWKE